MATIHQRPEKEANLESVNTISQTSFTSNHEDYDKYRPSYIEPVVKFVATLHKGKNILEIAAGTGKFTEQILKYLPNEHFVAVEPSEGMLKSFAKNLPQVKAVRAASDKLPFEENSFDTIYIAQAFHWFANRESVEEIYRVLSPGGTLVMVWNKEDDKNMDPDGWQSKSTAAVHKFDHNVPQYRHLNWTKILKESEDLFSAFSRKEFPFDLKIGSREDLWGYWASRSYVTALSEPEREKLKQEVINYAKEANGELIAKRASDVVYMQSKKSNE